MFNSTVLEVVIGLVFLYLSLSLACSALNEYYSALMSRRAAHLRDSLSTLFNKDDPKGLAFLLDFYNHPMISGLAPTRRRPDASSRRDVSMGLSLRQKLVVVPARLGADALGWLIGVIGAVLGALRWVLDAVRDPYGAGGVLSGMRKELATAARATPTYIPDRVFSDAIFAVLASDAGASRRLMVELHDQLSGSDAAFRALPDPETGKTLVANLEKASRALRAEVDEATAPEAIMASASTAFGGLLDGLAADDSSTAPALALLDARIADPATAPGPAGGASTAASTRQRIEGLRKGLVADAGALPDGSTKRELIRLAGQSAWFAGLRTPPEPRAYLANLKEALVARDEARAKSLGTAREHVANATQAVLAVGPKLPDEALVRDHVWEALRASLGHLGAAVATLPEGPPRAALVAVIAGASGGIAARRAQEPMTLGRAKDAAKEAFGSIRGTLEGLVDEADRAKVSAWVAREEALLAASEGDLLTLAKLRDAVAALPECDVRVALFALMDEVGDDLDRVKRNIQVWYNDTMERVSGRYKRTTQVLLTIIALGLVAALNADTIRIAQRLWGDPSLRVKIEAEADLATKEMAQAQAQPPPKAPVAAPPGDGEVPLPPDPKLAIDRLLEQSGLPLGWTQAELEKLGIGREALLGRRTVAPSGATEYGRWARRAAGLLAEKLLGTPEGLSKLAGLALTAIAVSMGAPFWFDVLNKVVNVRTAGLRPPKSADEPPAAPSGR